MSLTCGIRVAINGSETDTDVEADNASWTTKVGNVRHTVGGGSLWRPAQPGVAQLDVYVPLQLAPKIRTVTIAVSLVPSTAATMPWATVGAGSANAYRIIFHGDVQNIRGTTNPEGYSIVQVDAVSEMSGLLNRKARVAAANNSGIVSLLDAIETAHSLTMGGNDSFPQVADGFKQCDRPAQKRNTNGQWIQKMLAGTAINMSEEWITSITAPALRWRADFQDFDYYSGFMAGTSYEDWEMYFPWLFSYPDVGIQYEDFVARVNVEGETSAGVEHYGWAQLYSAADRASVGRREVSLDTWVDSATECQSLARRLIAYQGEPNYLNVKSVVFNSEQMFAAIDAKLDGTTDTHEALIFKMVAGMPGDAFTVRDPFGNGHGLADDWPAHAPAGGSLYDTLDGILHPVLTYNATTETTDQFTIRTFTRQFTPTGGWDVTLGVQPFPLSYGLRLADVTEYSNGTY